MSFYDDAKFMFLAGGAAGKDGKVYNIKPEEEVTGSEIIVNGDFEVVGPGTGGLLTTNSYGDYGWNISSGQPVGSTSKITGGVLTIANGSNSGGLAYATTGSGGDRDVFSEDGDYKLVYTITETDGGELRARWSGVNHTLPSSVGTHVVAIDMTTSGSDAIFYFFLNTANKSISIDNVSIKKYGQKPYDFTFTRGTNLTATRVGKDGYIEKGRENLFLNSNGFDLGTGSDGWGKTGDTATNHAAVVTSGYTGYDGSSNAFKVLAEDTNDDSSGDQLCFLFKNISTSGVQTLSAYVKGGNTNFVRVIALSGSGNTAVFYDLTGNGAVGHKQNEIDATITSIGSDWYRITSTFDRTITQVRFYVSSGDGLTDPAEQQKATEGDYIFIQNAQLEQGLVATDYIETGATTATAGLLEDEPRFDYTGGGCPALLMEPTRTNELPHSEYFTNQTYWQLNSDGTRTDNAAVSPEGIKNAMSLESVGSEYNILRSAPQPLDTSTEYVFSFYAKNVDATNAHYRVFNDSGDVVGATSYISQLSTTEWKRIEVSFTTTATDTNYSVYFASGNLGGKILLWGAQLEKATYSSSYIPTYGAAATRAKEGATDSYDQTSILDLSSSGLDGEDVSWFFELKNNQDVLRDGGGLNIRVSSNTSNLGSFRIYRSSSSDTRRMSVVFQDTGSNFTPMGYETTSENPKILVRRTWSTGRIQVHVDGVSVIDETDSDYNAWYKLELAGAGSVLELKQAIAFDQVLSTNDSEIITGTSYTNFAAMASELSYTEYE